MQNTSSQSPNHIEILVHTYGNILFRICLITLGNASDAEDVVQETFIKYLQKAPTFENAEHEKAWLITVATNKCRDILRFKSRHLLLNQEEIRAYTEPETDNASDSGILEALMTLPDKFRTVLILHYVEGYGVKDIASMIGKSSSAVKMRLQKGRRLLKEVYGKEYL